MPTATKKLTEFTVVSFSENGACEYTAKVRASEYHITNTNCKGEVSSEWTVMVQTPSSKAYRTLGSYRGFDTLQEVEQFYKGLVGIVSLDSSLRASALIKRVSGK